jgi:hypothetical protein
MGLLPETRETPTAVQCAAGRQEIASRLALFAPGGLGVAWMAQVLPFQCSASVMTAELVSDTPTAVQLAAETQDTPNNNALVAPAGLGVGSIAHLAVPAKAGAASHTTCAISATVRTDPRRIAVHPSPVQQADRRRPRCGHG